MDYAEFEPEAVYDEIAALELDELRAWLQALPCCTASEHGILGDPVNVVLVGEIDDIRSVLAVGAGT
jgi:hypothetical protein